VIDVYAKASNARLKSTSHFTASGPGVGSDATQPLQPDRIDTSFAGGAGAQFKLGSWALGAEYKQFVEAGGRPGLLAIGFAWNFF
jgi:opacity protein-like surface antigen